jgi:hypothetical protein
MGPLYTLNLNSATPTVNIHRVSGCLPPSLCRCSPVWRPASGPTADVPAPAGASFSPIGAVTELVLPGSGIHLQWNEKVGGWRFLTSRDADDHRMGTVVPV